MSIHKNIPAVSKNFFIVSYHLIQILLPVFSYHNCIIDKNLIHSYSFVNKSIFFLTYLVFKMQFMASPSMAVSTINPQFSYGSSQWSIVSVSEQASIDHHNIPMPIELSSTGSVALGSVFPSKDSMVSSIHAYHLKNFLEFQTLKSDPKRYYLVCKFGTCAFLLRSRSLGDAWRIKKLVAHTCAKDIRLCAEP